MQLFKNGGTCATPTSALSLMLAQYKRRNAIKAQRKAIQHDDVLACRQRMAEERGKVIRRLGTDYIGHPENTHAKWGHGNVHK